MSHRATNWAIQQRGLQPATKLLLWQLADRHNADTGRCDPSQERLVEDCEMSPASINRHLNKLEAAGLIRRIQRVNGRTKRQETTFYVLAFDTNFSMSQDETRPDSQLSTEPSLNSDASRLSNCETNPVREPGREPLSAAGAAPTQPSDGFCGVYSDALFDDFWAAHPKTRDREKTAKLFAEAIESGLDAQSIVDGAKLYRAHNEGNPYQYLMFSDNWLRARRWEDFDGVHLAKPARRKPTATEIGIAADEIAKRLRRDRGPSRAAPDIATFWAEKIKAKGFVPPDAISAPVASEMLARGLVTAAELRDAGVAA